jgi:cell fate regulator YaaT (PSP1 superfamily)
MKTAVMKTRLSQNVKKALEMCKRLARSLKLNMEVTTAKYLPEEKKIVFEFTAPERVDFRELLKQLKKRIKVRIELHQLEERDKALKIGGLPPCGMTEICCRQRGRYFQPTKKMLEIQGIKPSHKIYGCCGRVKCCYSYEYLKEQYTTENYPSPCGSCIFKKERTR